MAEALPTIERALELLERKEISAVELTQACLDRISQTDPALKAWVRVDETGALEQAAEADRGQRGRLHGIPFAIKDIIDVAGLPTRGGSHVLDDAGPADVDAACVARLREEGAVILGKTNTHELAYGYVTSPTSNPWDLNCIPGGSSGGSAVAVSAGQALGGLGSDTGGSIRVPAALCGISGLKPTSGIVPMDGVIPLSPSLDTLGPLARDMVDLSIIWAVLSGHEPNLGIPAFRLGLLAPETLGDDVDPQVLDAVDRAAEQIADIANSSKRVEVPNFEEFLIPRGAIVIPEALAAHRARGWWPDRADRYTEETRSLMSFGEMFLSDEMAEIGRAEATRLSAALWQVFDEIDVLALPTVPCPAPTHIQAQQPGEDGVRRPVATKLGRLPSPFNMANLAAISIPAGFTTGGLPIGLQLAARSEDLLIAIGAAFQRETDWHLRRPPLGDHIARAPND